MCGYNRLFLLFAMLMRVIVSAAAVVIMVMVVLMCVIMSAAAVGIVVMVVFVRVLVPAAAMLIVCMRMVVVMCHQSTSKWFRYMSDCSYIHITTSIL